MSDKFDRCSGYSAKIDRLPGIPPDFKSNVVKPPQSKVIVVLTTGEVREVLDDQIESFLEKNQDLIQDRQSPRKRPIEKHYRTISMDLAKRQRLEAAGWKIGTVAEFLELTPVESEIVKTFDNIPYQYCDDIKKP